MSFRNALGRRCGGSRTWSQTESTRHERGSQISGGPHGQLEYFNWFAESNGSGQHRGQVLYPNRIHRGFQREVQAKNVRGGCADDAQLQY